MSPRTLAHLYHPMQFTPPPPPALCTAFAIDSALGNWREKGCGHVTSDLQSCCIATAEVCWLEKRSSTLTSQRRDDMDVNVEGPGSLLLAAPESRYSATAVAAVELQLPVAGIYSHKTSSAVLENDSTYSSPIPPPFLNVARHHLSPSASRAHVLLDCGIHFSDSEQGTLAPHMPLMLVEALSKVNAT
jgi:hypothetical protein